LRRLWRRRSFSGFAALRAAHQPLTRLPSKQLTQIFEQLRTFAFYSFLIGKKTKPIQMNQSIAHVALVVKDYDEAIAFYTQKLDFQLLEDTKLSDEKRWVMIAPQGAKECCLLLAKAANEKQTAAIGNQTGGRVAFFLFTDDFWRDYEKLTSRAVSFIRPPEDFDYGTVAVFEDLYGNLWDLIQPNENNKGIMR
jgi:catechol 2,3-dioxygenase-like lactoylglutathione lyase family enzyme